MRQYEQYKTTAEILDEALNCALLSPEEKDTIRRRHDDAKGYEEAELLHDINRSPSESEYFVGECHGECQEQLEYRGFGYYIGISSLPLCIVAYAVFFYAGPWGALAFLLPGVAVIVGMLVDEREGA